MLQQNLPYLLVSVKDELFAINTSYVAGILQIPKWIKIPMMPDYIRGAFNFRGKIIHLIDLRVKLGIKSAISEIQESIDLLNAREQDHINWMTELEKCVREKKEFKLARDPHKCAFGKWYYSFKTENRSLQSILNDFEDPHARIHAIADEVIGLAEQGNIEKANQIIENSKITYLYDLINLFKSAKKEFSNAEQEILVVIENDMMQVGISVDKVFSVEYLDENTFDPISSVANSNDSELFRKTALRSGTDEIIFIMETQALFENCLIEN